MTDLQKIGLFLLCFGVFGIIATAAIGELAGVCRVPGPVGPWLGYSLLFDFIWIVIGLGLLIPRKRQ